MNKKNEKRLDLVHYSEGIPSAIHRGYFVLVNILLCYHYPSVKLKGLSFVGVSEIGDYAYGSFFTETPAQLYWEMTATRSNTKSSLDIKEEL